MPKLNHYDPGFHPQDLIRRMSEGQCDVHVQAAWGVSLKVFYSWLREHEELREAADTAYPAWEVAWLAKGEAQAERGNSAYFKYWNMVMGVKAAAAYRQLQKSEGTNTTINVQNMNVIDNKTTEELLTYVSTKMDKLKDLGVIDAEFKAIDDQSE